MKYTEKIHVEGLLKILSDPNSCRCCPSKEMRYTKFYQSGGLIGLWAGEVRYITTPQCDVCWGFIEKKQGTDGWGACPCFNKKGVEVNKLTWLALEAKGYI